MELTVSFPAIQGFGGTIPGDEFKIVDLPEWWPPEWLDWALVIMPAMDLDGSLLRAALGLPSVRAIAKMEAVGVRRRMLERALVEVMRAIEKEGGSPEKAVEILRGRFDNKKRRVHGNARQ